MSNHTRLSRRWLPILSLTGLSVLIAPTRASGAQAPSLRAAPTSTSTSTATGTSACQPTWLPTFGRTAQNVEPFALAVFDDGTGSALYAGTTTGVRRWNGTSWSTVGSGLGFVFALTVFDDGSGPALFAGGFFTVATGAVANNIAKWNGSSWSPLGSGTSSPVQALAVFDDGSGPALFVGGSFTSAGGVAAGSIAKWNGSSWSALGLGTNNEVDALAVFDDGSGPALFVGGSFTTADLMPAHEIARWNGSSWSPLGSGMDNIVSSLSVFDDGSGPALYAGGTFTTAGGAAASRIAKWNGASWSPLGAGMSGYLYYTTVNALIEFDDGSGSALYAAGAFTTADQAPARYIARWNGTGWSDLESGMSGNQFNSIYSLAVFDDGAGPALYAGGDFPNSPAGDRLIAKWGNPQGCGSPGSALCQPGVGAVIGCPCNNDPPATGPGCDNSAHTGGARLSATGIARVTYDTLVFTTHGETPTATSIVLQGDNQSSSGVVFGQGVRCVTGQLRRLYLEHASGGSITAPRGSDLHVHARSAELGDSIAPGTHRYYGVYYRDPSVVGGCPAASTFNMTQQLDVLWGA